MSQVLVLNGPNLNLLGSREPEKYGTATLADMQKGVEAAAARTAEQGGLSVGVTFFQSNSEGALIDRVQSCLLYTSPSPRDGLLSRMPSSA